MAIAKIIIMPIITFFIVSILYHLVEKKQALAKFLGLWYKCIQRECSLKFNLKGKGNCYEEKIGVDSGNAVIVSGVPK